MHIVLKILATSRVLEKAAARVFREHGLTSAQFNVLNLLAGSPQGMRASDLAGALIVDPSNITGLLKRMGRDGLLVHIESPQDRRQVVVGLSAKGRTLWSRAHRDYERCLEAVAAPIPESRIGTASGVLEAIASAAALLP